MRMGFSVHTARYERNRSKSRGACECEFIKRPGEGEPGQRLCELEHFADGTEFGRNELVEDRSTGGISGAFLSLPLTVVAATLGPHMPCPHTVMAFCQQKD
jgi:hypothetical protein